MLEEKRIAAIVRGLEDVLLEHVHIRKAQAMSRIIVQDCCELASDRLKLTISLKEILEKPAFFVIKFDAPDHASFTFTHFDRSGRRLVNRKKLREMAGYLNDRDLAEDFASLVEAKIAELSA